MKHSLPAVVISGLLLGLFGVLGAALVGFSHQSTAERIVENERQTLLEQLSQLVPSAQIDNDLLNDMIEIAAPEALGAERTRVYRGRLAGEPVAAVLSPVVTQGYNGSIRLIVAIRSDGSLLGVRVLAHRETPGLGDKIEVKRADWILSFNGKSLDNPTESGWRVKRDGGEFDQFTGATITPRAVVRGVQRSLEYFVSHHAALFAGGVAAGEKSDE